MVTRTEVRIATATLLYVLRHNYVEQTSGDLSGDLRGTVGFSAGSARARMRRITTTPIRQPDSITHRENVAGKVSWRVTCCCSCGG